jgi:hypothetical protein
LDEPTDADEVDVGTGEALAFEEDLDDIQRYEKYLMSPDIVTRLFFLGDLAHLARDVPLAKFTSLLAMATPISDALEPALRSALIENISSAVTVLLELYPNDEGLNDVRKIVLEVVRVFLNDSVISIRRMAREVLCKLLKLYSDVPSRTAIIQPLLEEALASTNEEVRQTGASLSGECAPLLEHSFLCDFVLLQCLHQLSTDSFHQVRRSVAVALVSVTSHLQKSPLTQHSAHVYLTVIPMLSLLSKDAIWSVRKGVASSLVPLLQGLLAIDASSWEQYSYASTLQSTSSSSSSSSSSTAAANDSMQLWHVSFTSVVEQRQALEAQHPSLFPALSEMLVRLCQDGSKWVRNESFCALPLCAAMLPWSLVSPVIATSSESPPQSAQFVSPWTLVQTLNLLDPEGESSVYLAMALPIIVLNAGFGAYAEQLHPLHVRLAHDLQFRCRKSCASSLFWMADIAKKQGNATILELAQWFGPMCEMFLQDLDPVKMALLERLPQLLALFPDTLQVECLERLPALLDGADLNWRLRLQLAQGLPLLCQHFCAANAPARSLVPLSEIIVPIFLQLAFDSVAAIRLSARESCGALISALPFAAVPQPTFSALSLTTTTNTNTSGNGNGNGNADSNPTLRTLSSWICRWIVACALTPQTSYRRCILALQLLQAGLKSWSAEDITEQVGQCMLQIFRQSLEEPKVRGEKSKWDTASLRWECVLLYQKVCEQHSEWKGTLPELDTLIFRAGDVSDPKLWEREPRDAGVDMGVSSYHDGITSSIQPQDDADLEDMFGAMDM